MVDFAMDVHKSLYPDREVPNTLKDKRALVVENFKKLQGETEPVLKIFVDAEVQRQMQLSRDSKQLLDFLVKGYNFKTEMIDTCYTSPSSSTSVVTTLGPASISISIESWYSPLTRTISTECGVNW